MDLFNGIRPNWLGPEQRALAAQQLAEPFSQAFQSSFAQSSRQKWADQDREDHQASILERDRKLAELDQEQTRFNDRFRQEVAKRGADKIRRIWEGEEGLGSQSKWMEEGGQYLNPGDTSVAPPAVKSGGLKDAKTFSDALSWLQQHPDAAMDPDTKPVVDFLMKNFKEAEDIKAAAIRAEAYLKSNKWRNDSQKMITDFLTLTTQNPALHSEVFNVEGGPFNVDPNTGEPISIKPEALVKFNTLAPQYGLSPFTTSKQQQVLDAEGVKQANRIALETEKSKNRVALAEKNAAIKKELLDLEKQDEPLNDQEKREADSLSKKIDGLNRQLSATGLTDEQVVGFQSDLLDARQKLRDLYKGAATRRANKPAAVAPSSQISPWEKFQQWNK